MSTFLRSTIRHAWGVGTIVFTLLFGASDLSAQIAGYSVGTRGLNVRAIPCSHTRPAGLLCQPSGDVYLRFRGGELVEIDTSWSRDTTALMGSPDVWREIQGALITRFGEPDSTRTMNPLRLARAYSEGLAVFWTKTEWCAVLTVKTVVTRSGFFFPVELIVEKLDSSGYNCSVYPTLEKSP